jgi:hypothetical protein
VRKRFFTDKSKLEAGPVCRIDSLLETSKIGVNSYVIFWSLIGSIIGGVGSGAKGGSKPGSSGIGSKEPGGSGSTGSGLIVLGGSGVYSLVLT